MLSENVAIRRLLETRGFELARTDEASVVAGRLRLDPGPDTAHG